MRTVTAEFGMPTIHRRQIIYPLTFSLPVLILENIVELESKQDISDYTCSLKMTAGDHINFAVHILVPPDKHGNLKLVIKEGAKVLKAHPDAGQYHEMSVACQFAMFAHAPQKR